MITLPQILANVKKQQTQSNALVALLSGLQEQISTVLASWAMTVDAGPEIDKLFAAIEADRIALVNAMFIVE